MLSAGIRLMTSPGCDRASSGIASPASSPAAPAPAARSHNGGTIPDRGLFGVFLAGGEVGRTRRVGELDEEMVYESRVGDVFLLGSTSWRIEDITARPGARLPGAGQPGRLPFWKGDAPGRPVEFGTAIGAFTRELAPLTAEDATARAAPRAWTSWQPPT